MKVHHPNSYALLLLGQARLTTQDKDQSQELRIQPKPMQLLAYLALNRSRPQRRELLQSLFWPQKSTRAAANNLRQALWHLRQVLPSETLAVGGETVGWNAVCSVQVDVFDFDAAVAAGDMDTALGLYGGPFLPDCYDEWAQLERERLQMVYLATLEARAHDRYQAWQWDWAEEDIKALQAADPFNEAAVRLLMSCHWAQNQRESARRCYDTFKQRIQRDLGVDPLPETTALYQRILRGAPHPAHAPAPADAQVAAKTQHLFLLETLGAFRQGLKQAQELAQADRAALRTAGLQWQGRFYLRLGQLDQAQKVLESVLEIDGCNQAEVLADLATVETGLGDYAAAGGHYAQALACPTLDSRVRLGLLSSLGGLKGRMGQLTEAQMVLEEAVDLAQKAGDPAGLAVASGNLGIMLIGRGEKTAAERALQAALQAAQQADAHWLTAHVTGHLGVLAQDRQDLAAAAQHYQSARTLTQTIGDQRCATLWTMNLGVVRYEQGLYFEALPLLQQGRAQAIAQGSRALAAGASIFIGSCLIAKGRGPEGLASIEEGLTAAREIGDQERVLIGLLHRGRALASLGQPAAARRVLQEGFEVIASSKMRRMESLFLTELEKLDSIS